MKKRQLALYIAIPVIYLLITLFLLLMHNFDKKKFTEHLFGELTISGISAPGIRQREKLVELTIGFAKLLFRFSTETPLEWIDDLSGSRQPLFPLSYTPHSRGVRILFTAGVFLDFLHNPAIPGSLEMSYGFPARAAQQGTLQLFIQPVRTAEKANIPLVILTTHKGDCYLWSEAPCVFSCSNGYLSLIMQKNEAAQHIHFTYDNGKTDPYLFWYNQTGRLTTAEICNQSLNRFLNRAYTGWLKDRYSAARGLWKTQADDYAASESLLYALLSEAMVRGELQAGLNLYRNFTRKNRDQAAGFTGVCSVFTGGLEAYHDRQQAADLLNLDRIGRQIRERDPAVFKPGSPVLTILNKGIISDIDNLIENVVMTADPADLDPETWLGMLETSLDISTWLSSKQQYFNGFAQLIYRQLLPAMLPARYGIFCKGQQPDTLDLELTLRAGRILAAVAATENHDLLKSFARTLIHSVLQFAGPAGFLPASLTLSPEGESHFSRIIAPEEVYPLVTNNPWLPVELPLYPLLKPGSWLYTCARVTGMQATSLGLQLSLTLPEGTSHYLLVQELEEVTVVRVNGREITNTAEYADLASGWYYDPPPARTLYLKLQQTEPQSVLEIEITN